VKIAVILGTSKTDGNTRALVDEFVAKYPSDIFDLSQFEISFFDYSHRNKVDDFLPLMEKLVTYDHLVFATPIYWYSMSAQLKVFFDRFSDLLTIEKGLGRNLKGKSISVLSTGYDLDCPDCFVQPFELTGQYLGLTFKGCDYLSVQTKIEPLKLAKAAERAVKKVT